MADETTESGGITPESAYALELAAFEAAEKHITMVSYDRLAESEKRQKVATLLLDHQREKIADHRETYEGEARVNWLSVELILGWMNTMRRALDGDFDYVKSTVFPESDLMVQLLAILGE